MSIAFFGAPKVQKMYREKRFVVTGKASRCKRYLISTLREGVWMTDARGFWDNSEWTPSEVKGRVQRLFESVGYEWMTERSAKKMSIQQVLGSSSAGK